MKNLRFYIVGFIVVVALILVFISLEIKLFRKIDPYKTFKEYMIGTMSLLFGLIIIAGFAVFFFRFAPNMF